MEIFLVFLVVFLVVNGYVFLEEETIIIFCFFVWLDAAGGVFRKVIKEELEDRGDILKVKFLWYFETRQRIGQYLKEYHQERANIAEVVKVIYGAWVEKYVGWVGSWLIKQDTLLKGRGCVDQIIYTIIKERYPYDYSVSSISVEENYNLVSSGLKKEGNDFFASNVGAESALDVKNFDIK